jgi:hypothetical protein
MNVVRRLFLATALLATALHGNAKSPAPECLAKEVEAHVLRQFGIYGPLSANREYFGFIYLHDGVIGSAVTRSQVCAKGGYCSVDSKEAVRSIPQEAKVLGEWHTHPHHGSRSLSGDDVRGAYNNRHIGCYFAFYSTPSGAIYAWNANRISVPVAMASRTRIGNYRDSAYVATAAMRNNSRRSATTPNRGQIDDTNHCARGMYAKPICTPISGVFCRFETFSVNARLSRKSSVRLCSPRLNWYLSSVSSPIVES